jgi:hypothetical protein
MDSREFTPSKKQTGLWEKNPSFTGNKFELFKEYPVEILQPLDGVEKYMKSKNIKMQRVPSGQLYILDDKGRACFLDAVEGVHFKLKE